MTDKERELRAVEYERELKRKSSTADPVDQQRDEWEREDNKRKALLLDVVDLVQAWLLTGDDRVKQLIIDEVRAAWGPKAAVAFGLKADDRTCVAFAPDGRKLAWGGKPS